MSDGTRGMRDGAVDAVWDTIRDAMVDLLRSGASLDTFDAVIGDVRREALERFAMTATEADLRATMPDEFPKGGA